MLLAEQNEKSIFSTRKSSKFNQVKVLKTIFDEIDR